MTAEPAWVTRARSLIGEREIPGARHNSRIVAWFKRWAFNDETPWCGAFVHHCLESAGIAGPKVFVRAKDWGVWGVPCNPQIGAIGVKSRAGGGHVFIIVGETPDGRYLKALGGNQGNAVSIIDIAKADVIAIRWPAGVPIARLGLPVLARGQSGVSEA